MDKLAKKKAAKEFDGVRKELDGAKMDLDQLESHLTHLPLFHRVIYKSVEKGILEAVYSNMTLKFYVKSGIIQLDSQFMLWNENLTGYVGRYSLRTLKMECSDGEELD